MISSRSKRIAYTGVLLALSLILSYLESLIPISIGIPGIKIGLANATAIVALVVLSPVEAYLIQILRVIVSALLFGSIAMIPYGMAGAMISVTIMIVLLKTERFSAVAVSAVGGVCHNLGQVIVAMILMENKYVLYYFPVLCLSGVLFGALIGVVGGIVAKRISRIESKSQ